MSAFLRLTLSSMKGHKPGYGAHSCVSPDSPFPAHTQALGAINRGRRMMTNNRDDTESADEQGNGHQMLLPSQRLHRVRCVNENRPTSWRRTCPAIDADLDIPPAAATDGHRAIENDGAGTSQLGPAPDPHVRGADSGGDAKTTVTPKRRVTSSVGDRARI
ncbi:hypothetical protein GALMADRAFT_1362965 [Galerina marginata CBS 339.88]|uniref:Uncharacterized protein n=1 Tax=Galerina marginata (strain CBS 339.88) TaxID=685588 RepID=A0A067TGV3_GALM3|nr:hypothetical protein GALMADRAFT_1362965 [Galerina marginata CBS 339.88]